MLLNDLNLNFDISSYFRIRPLPPQVALVVKNPPANAGDARDVGLIPGSVRSPGRGNAPYCSTLTWKIPWAEKPGGLHSKGPQRVGHD